MDQEERLPPAGRSGLCPPATPLSLRSVLHPLGSLQLHAAAAGDELAFPRLSEVQPRLGLRTCFVGRLQDLQVAHSHLGEFYEAGLSRQERTLPEILNASQSGDRR